MKRATETQLVRSVLDYLGARHIFAWRANSGAVTATYRGKKRFFRFSGVKGLSDIIGVLPDGRFLAIECKMPGKAPTLDQIDFIDRIIDEGGVAFWSDNIDDVMKKIASETAWRGVSR